MKSKYLIYSNLINYIDFFGLSYNFTIDKKDKLKTTTGAIFSIFFILITISLFFGFGIDLYQRKRPKISNNSKLTIPQEKTFSNNNFTFAFRVEDRLGAMVQNDSIVSLDISYHHYVMNERGVWNLIFSEITPYKKCNEFNYTSEKEAFYNISLASWYCIDFDNFKLGGYWDTSFVYGFIINTKQCKYSKNNTCLNDKDLKENFQNPISGSNYFYSFLYMEALPQMDDYEKPINLHLINRYELLSLKASKRVVQIYKQVTVNNDRGWFFSEIEEKNFYSSDSISPDFTLKDEFTEDLVYSHIIYFGNKIDIYSRSYTKIQEVIANIGGFTKIFYTILSFIYGYFGNYIKTAFLLNKIDFQDLLGKKNFSTKKNYEDINKKLNINNINLPIDNSNLSANNLYNFTKQNNQNLPNLIRIRKSQSHFENNLNVNKIKSTEENILRKNKRSFTQVVEMKFKKFGFSNKSGIFEIFVFKLCNFKKSKRFDFYDFQKFLIHFDNNMSIMNYYKICNNLENMKKILFEENHILFNKIKPNLNRSFSSSENNNLFQNTKKKNIYKSDRILNNLFNKVKIGT